MDVAVKNIEAKIREEIARLMSDELDHILETVIEVGQTGVVTDDTRAVLRKVKDEVLAKRRYYDAIWGQS